MLNRIHPSILLIISALSWGGNFIFGRAVTDELTPFTLAFFRWVVAFIVFLPFAAPSLKRDWKQIKQYLPVVSLMALTGIAANNTIIYFALHHTTAINASLVNSTTPILIYILSYLFLQERLSKVQLIGTTISLTGVLFIISNGSLKNLLQLSFNYGDLIVLTAAITWSIYSLLLRRYADKLPTQSTFLVNIIIGTIILFPFFIYELLNPSLSYVWSSTSIAAILYTGIFASIVSIVCWNVGVVRIGANKAGIYLNLIPVFSTILAVIFIGETLYLFQVIGGLLVVLGVYLSSKN